MNTKDPLQAYIEGFPDNIQLLLNQLRDLIRRLAPAAQEAMKYGIPTFILHENLVHFAAYEKHIGFYPTPSAISAFKNELSSYKSAKGSVQFPLDQPLPWELIERMLKYRIKAVRQNHGHP